MTEKNRLVLIIDGFMHHGTVPKMLDVRIKTLIRVTPRNLTIFFTWKHPVAEATEVILELFSVLCRREIDECESFVQVCLEGDG